MPENPESEGSRLITLKQIELEHGVSRSALHTYRRSASFPQPVPVEGSTKTQYNAAEVAAWFEANPKQQGRKREQFVSHQQGDPVSATVDPRIAILSALSDPPINKVTETPCVPWDDAVKLLHAYRAFELRLAADAIEQEFLDGITDSERDQTWNAAVRAIATALRQSAEEPEG